MTAYMEPMIAASSTRHHLARILRTQAVSKKIRAVNKQIYHKQDIDINNIQCFHLPAALPTELTPFNAVCEDHRLVSSIVKSYYNVCLNMPSGAIFFCRCLALDKLSKTQKLYRNSKKAASRKSREAAIKSYYLAVIITFVTKKCRNIKLVAGNRSAEWLRSCAYAWRRLTSFSQPFLPAGLQPACGMPDCCGAQSPLQ